MRLKHAERIERERKKSREKKVDKIFVPKSICVEEEIWREENQSDGGTISQSNTSPIVAVQKI